MLVNRIGAPFEKYAQERLLKTLQAAIICILELIFYQPGWAQQRSEAENTKLQGDISALKTDVRTIGEQQRQIINQLNELRRLLPTNVSGQPTAQPPATLDIREERSRGKSSARVAIVEYSDFECPFCGKYERETYPQIFENYIKTSKVKLYYRDLPLPMHPHAVLAARASHCAGEQGKYWEMHDDLFANQTALGIKDISDRAQSLGIDAVKLSECISSEKYTDDIRKSMDEAQKLGISGTPTFFLGTIGPNGDAVNIQKRIVGARPYTDFQSALDELLASKTPEAVSVH